MFHPVLLPWASLHLKVSSISPSMADTAQTGTFSMDPKIQRSGRSIPENICLRSCHSLWPWIQAESWSLTRMKPMTHLYFQIRSHSFTSLFLSPHMPSKQGIFKDIFSDILGKQRNYNPHYY